MLAIGTLDTVNDLPLALRLIRHGDARRTRLFIGALSGGDTLPQLRAAMRAADAVAGVAAPHVHPRIEAVGARSAARPTPASSSPVVDVDRVAGLLSARSQRLVADLRAMGATNILRDRARLASAEPRATPQPDAFADAGNGGRTVETFEILHFAAWTPATRLMRR